eukprot:TRINITY_DN5157_c1_g6_i1.p1 TRINITY_DN5157_c1_g6~~TRINITY_DN5157_c1_g6_i1.p1  ORF type:complete len:250 (+),score=91.66 TRINITY_DN5157_c1_g6_i1:53-751(+)
MSLPWSNYAAPQQKVTYVAMATQYGLVSMPVTAAVVTADPDTLMQDLHVMRMQLETFFGCEGEYGDKWWDEALKGMVVGPEDLLSMTDVLTAISKIGKYSNDAEGQAKVYTYVARFLKQPTMWPAANTVRNSLGATFLRKSAVELVACATRGKTPPSGPTILKDFVAATDHLVMLSTTPTTDDPESLIMKATMQLATAVVRSGDTDYSGESTECSSTNPDELELEGMPTLLE